MGIHCSIMAIPLLVVIGVGLGAAITVGSLASYAMYKRLSEEERKEVDRQANMILEQKLNVKFQNEQDVKEYIEKHPDSIKIIDDIYKDILKKKKLLKSK
jgi:Na+-transporting NADH:ubiquinone oxidoreductase subunit NqrC